ncbi:uncharacterized protein BDZ83DRAFT_308790 [Colletotrichum acutatum]|uniref:Uncharacterized protein n=1 Tax=Glomerella acutata TaxID=27357 RepID=A0AAD8UPA9_GLOAC|nr:uncharacterized protein BDZ83DRAFT_308790 [Colletotrichum acutatum]KAK1725258.1 hypothetical protein BDZ83DRAFT_308790 [Colletotrichum acutatum]
MAHPAPAVIGSSELFSCLEGRIVGPRSPPRLWKLDNQHGCLGRKKNKLALWSRDMTDGNLLWSSSGAEGGDAGLTEACQFQLTAMGSVVTVCNAFFPSRQVTLEAGWLERLSIVGLVWESAYCEEVGGREPLPRWPGQSTGRKSGVWRCCNLTSSFFWCRSSASSSSLPQRNLENVQVPSDHLPHAWEFNTGWKGLAWAR